MSETVGRAIYKRVADDLRSQIASGKLKVEDKIPSTPKLIEIYGVSNTAVRNAVALLRGEGLVRGEPGKAVYVIATPAEVEAERIETDDLARQVAELRTEVRSLTERLDARPGEEDLAVQVAELRGLVEQLYTRLGHALPSEATTELRRNTGS